MTMYGYARVSTREQNLTGQIATTLTRSNGAPARGAE
jgi:DNA invertase Pin-like site-specific DNA recombinase